MPDTIQIRAASRLHFGLMSFGRSEVPSYGGVGVMVRDPPLELQIESAHQLTADGLLADRVMSFARAAIDHWQLDERAACALKVTSAPPAHHGLGSGTQLALSVAVGLRKFLDLPPATEHELAECVGRGRRSSVGVHGFFRGGLIVDAGHTEGESLGRLGTRLPLPSAWRFVLVRASGPAGRSGIQEHQAFEHLPPIPQHLSDRLFSLATDHLVPAVAATAFPEFSEHLYEYGRLAGGCFASCQGGPFASPAIAHLVDTFRSRGVRGVGQSSWGPTVFALAQDEGHAMDIIDQLRRDVGDSNHVMTITAPCNTGATIRHWE